MIVLHFKEGPHEAYHQLIKTMVKKILKEKKEKASKKTLCLGWD